MTSFEAIQTTIFNVSCISGGCHNASDRAGNTVLVEGQSYASLVNAVPFNAAAQAAGLRRVVPGHPEQSFLLTKLIGPGQGEASRMPLGANPLSPASIDQVRAWILAGAPGPGAPTATVPPFPSATPTLSFTAVPTLSSTPSATPLVTAATTPGTPGGPTSTPTLTPSISPTPTSTPTPSASPSPSVAATPTFSLASTLPQLRAAILNPTCLGLGCHNATDRSGNLNLEAGSAYADLVGVTPDNEAARLAGLLRVDAGKPENSFLITKLTLPVAFDMNFFSRMPLVGKLAPQQIEQIRAWILRGALPDETGP